MNVVGKVGSLIAQGVYTVSTPIHPFGGAVDIIVVQQPDGSFRTTPWYVRFGKFQGVLKGAEKIVRIEVDGVEADFHMLLDNSGEAYFLREISSGKDSECNDRTKDSDSLGTARDDASSIDYNDDDDRRKENVGHYRHEDSFSGTVEVLQDEHISLGVDRIEINESDNEMPFYDFQDEHFLDDSLELSEYGSSRYENLDSVDDLAESRILDSEVVLVSVDGTILTAPISSLERNLENLQSRSPQFQTGPGEGTEVSENNVDFSTGVTTSAAGGDVQEVQNNSNAVEPESNFHEGNQVDDCQHQETQMDEGKQEIKQSTAVNTDDVSIGLKRDDIFKSCLELHELDRTKSSISVILGDDEDPQEKSPHNLFRLDEDGGESVGISVNSEADEDTGENSPQKNFVVDEVDDGEVSVSIDSDKASLLKSNSPSNTTFPDFEVEKDLVETDVTPTAQNFHDTSTVNSPTNNLEQKNYVGSEQQQSNSERAVSEGDCTQSPTVESQTPHEEIRTDLSTRFEISVCGNLLLPGMGSREAAEIFDAHRISEEEYKISPASIIKNENLVVRFQKKYLTWEKAAPVVLGMAAYGLDLPVEQSDFIRVERDEILKNGEDECALPSTPSGRRWRLWSLPFRRVKTLEHTSSNLTTEEVVANVEHAVSTPTSSVVIESPHKQLLRTNVPTSEEIASLNLKEGKNMVNFIFSAGVLGKPNEVQAHIYLWKWNARIVISDVDGTITKSDVLGQFMPLVGRDWTQSGVARLFGAIKENGYQLLFLSARAIVQAYLTRSFLVNLKQDGKALPHGPVVISPDGLFPSLYREVIRRAPHEFKIACLEDIKALFPSDYNPFYAGFGNRDTDELAYRKVGIPKGKIFIINPKGEVAISHRIDAKSYTSLHTLVDDMFPPTSMVEQEDYNSWNYWRMPLPDIDIL
ncbi:phosphatidate phosphatase PAH1 [Apium graveolens]|uniref:phosphatidate phosphatase PAH1 n=1 Tax=Apium graveolens TaxID=4045 RepID=UPI003D7BBDAC